MAVSSHKREVWGSYLPSAVSVVVYIKQNDPRFLERCLVSIVSQQTDFPLEIIVLSDFQVAEDVEDMGREYAAIYPEKITFYPFPRRVGYIPFFSYDIEINSPYVILCSDKEVWTNPHKLQAQYDFLQTNPSYSVCMHAVSFVYDDPDQSVSSYDVIGRDAAFSDRDLSQLLIRRSALFRIKEYPHRNHFMAYQKKGITLFTEQVSAGRLKILPGVVSDVSLDTGEPIGKIPNSRIKVFVFYSK